MQKAIVCTTINPPTEALRKFRAMDGWRLIVVGDGKTPHEAYEGWDYLSPEVQHRRWPKLSNLIGWNCIQRRNLGIIEAYNWGAEIIATVDDDNIPLDGWGENLLVGRTVSARKWETAAAVFDPLSATEHPKLWHRGYPISMLPDRRATYVGMADVTPDVQADLWNGDPDVDAIGRIAFSPEVVFNDREPFFSPTISPFNSQNTFLSRKVIPDYFLYPHIGRYDDIWASYHVQQQGAVVVYGTASVYQRRNPHNLVRDMQAEMFGYEYTERFIAGERVLPEPSQAAFRAYREALG